MTWTVGTPIRAGKVTCVPISFTLVSVTGHTQRMAGHGQKRPALLLLFREESVTGHDLDGGVYDAENIERRYPNAIAMAQEKLNQINGVRSSQK